VGEWVTQDSRRRDAPSTCFELWLRTELVQPGRITRIFSQKINHLSHSRAGTRLANV
jgi:hypothetical protein